MKKQRQKVSNPPRELQQRDLASFAHGGFVNGATTPPGGRISRPAEAPSIYRFDSIVFFRY